MPASQKLWDRLRVLRGRMLDVDCVLVETSSACTNRCYMCPGRASKKRRKNMEDAVFEKIVAELEARGFAGEIYMFGQNEPLLDKKIFERIHEMKRRVPKGKIILISNFTRFPSQAIERLLALPLERLTTSIYALQPETYAKICGRDNFHNSFTNLITFIKRWRRIMPFMFTVCLIKSPYNEDDKPFINFFLDRIPCSGTARFPVIRQRNVIDKQRAPWMFSKCLYKTIKVTDNGRITICSFDPDAELEVGDIKETGLWEAADGAGARAIRRKIFFSGGNGELASFCHVCDYANEHKLLYFLLPFGEGVRKTIYRVLGVNRDYFRQWAQLEKRWNNAKEIQEKGDFIDRWFPDSSDDWVADLMRLKEAFYAGKLKAIRTTEAEK